MYKVVSEDILNIECDALVDSTNNHVHSGFAGLDSLLIHRGGEEVREFLETHPELQHGQALSGPAGDLKARRLILVVCPRWNGGVNGEAGQLTACYRAAIDKAKEEGLHSVAVTLLGTAAMGFPMEVSMECFEQALSGYRFDPDIQIILTILDREFFQKVRAPYLTESNISDRETDSILEKEWLLARFKGKESLPGYRQKKLSSQPVLKTTPIVPDPDDFRDLLLTYVREFKHTYPKELTRSYTDNMLNSALISKYCKGTCRPSKENLLLVCLALRLSEQKAARLLRAAGYSFQKGEHMDDLILGGLRKGVYTFGQLSC